MAREELSSGHGESGKSGRQDSTLSARRARLRSLTKNALPPDPYSSKKEEESQDEQSAAFAFDENGEQNPNRPQNGNAKAPTPTQSAEEAPPPEPWMAAMTPSTSTPNPDPAQIPMPTWPPADEGSAPQNGSSNGTAHAQDDVSSQPMDEYNPFAAASANASFASQTPVSVPYPTSSSEPDTAESHSLDAPTGLGRMAKSALDQLISTTSPASRNSQDSDSESSPSAGFDFGSADPGPGPDLSPPETEPASSQLPEPPSAESNATPEAREQSETSSETETEDTALTGRAARRRRRRRTKKEEEDAQDKSAETSSLEDEEAKARAEELIKQIAEASNTEESNEISQEPPPQEVEAEAIVQSEPEPSTETQPEAEFEQTSEPVPSAADEPVPGDEAAVGSNESNEADEDSTSSSIEPEHSETAEQTTAPEYDASEQSTAEEEAPEVAYESEKKDNSDSFIKEFSNDENTDSGLTDQEAPQENQDEPQEFFAAQSSEPGEPTMSSSETYSSSSPSANRIAALSHTPSSGEAMIVLEHTQNQMLELMNSIEQSMSICAMNLASLNSTGSEQIGAVNSLKDTLQNQTFLEIGLNLNTMMETMSAALEPMKAAGELVPAIDQLVSALESKLEKEEATRMSPEQLVTALADQLSAGQIDPWTFKSAYMAVFPDEHPADLLHRLVDLLGTQRLSGDLFRAAYDAVQMAEPPPRAIRTMTQTGEDGVTEVVRVVQDEEVLRQIEELRKSNDDLRTRFEDRESELSKRLEERESEYHEMLASKESEIQEAQEMLHSRFEEFNNRYEEMVETVNLRDEELKAKEDEVTRKESEISVLRNQLEELQEQFRDTVKDLQTQLTSTKQVAEDAVQRTSQALPAPGSPPTPDSGSPAKPDEQKRGGAFFDGGADNKNNFLSQGQSNPNLQKQMDTFAAMSDPNKQGGGGGFMGGSHSSSSQTSNSGFARSSTTAPIPEVSPNSSAPPTGPLQQEPSNQAVPKAPQASPGFASSAGSYGNGVRAQVFEVIVRQALAGAPWREICAGPMQVNNISPDEVEAEVKRREALLKK